ncbi:MAG: bifunctional phosphoribosylaminoimidazolecarboxamide formyltransferase/IMP cyclohydrolase [Bdellovibrionales bacterium]|nr:bifunctional phosphoribosylaminoimidazolecarboxamide formyltransferase/IMP cyclohydrolase [Bdellovibrionales bacterium]
MNETNVQIRRALISVTDKTNLDILVRVLVDHNVEIVSTGGTKKYIEELGFKVTPIELVTGNPEAFGGRMKSISFPVSSALLFRRHHEVDIQEARELKISPIDLVVCNLYTFEACAQNNADEDTLIENIDIGGPLMLRAAAKNYESVTVLSDISDYDSFLTTFKGETSFLDRRNYAVKTFNRIAKYDVAIADELQKRFDGSENTSKSWLKIDKKEDLRYGENPHQEASLFRLSNTKGKVSLVNAEILQGKELSYNNWVDADAAWRVMSDVALISNKRSVAAVIKHANPCGLSVAEDLFSALNEAWIGDQVSSFGGVLAFSETFDERCAKFLGEKFVEVIIAPDYSAEALKILSKKKNVRVLKTPNRPKDESEMILKSISGGLLMQNEDESFGKSEELKLVTKKEMPYETLELVDFGILACKHLKSNGIALACKMPNGNFTLAGTGMGQPNRLDSLRFLAKVRAENKGLKMENMLLVSDAFFPFSDSIEICHEVGIKSIIQPGGSIRDVEVISACDKFGIAMMTTGRRHFRH